MKPPGESPVRRGIRHVLLIGLGSVLAIMLALGLYASRALSSVSRAGLLTTHEYFRQSELLENIHALLWEAAGNVRDYLLDPDSMGLPQFRDGARSTWVQARKAIEDYRTEAEPAQKPLADRLAGDADAYWAVAENSLKLTGRTRSQEGIDLIIGKLVPARERLFATISEIGARDRANLRSQGANTERFVESAENRLGAAVAFTVLLSLLVAGTTMLYLSRLERVASAQYQASLKASLELERLSRRLLSLQEDERRRIACELHDDYGQRMASLLFELSAVAERVELAPEEKGSLQKLEEGLRNLAKDLQQLSRSLHSAVLDRIGLEAAIRSDCNLLRNRTELKIEFEAADVPKRLADSTSLSVYRVFQEALQNALKHAQTDRLSVGLAVEDQELVLRVKDYGSGFETDSAHQTGSLGLVSMRERLGMVGGRLLIHSETGKGTEIEARVPVGFRAASL